MSRQKVMVNGAGWRIQWRKFGKDDALRGLAKCRQDRATNEAWVNALARTMDSGLWDTYSPSQTPIAFDRDGYRINGKHRLAAFVRSKLTEIIFPVIEGLNPEEFLKFDQNVRVRRHDMAHPGRPNVFRDEARINWLEAIVTADPSVKVTTQVFDMLADGKWRKQLEWANDTIPVQGRQGKAPYVAALMYAHRADPDLAERVGKAWANGGAGLPPALLRLRDDALSRASARKQANSTNNRGRRFGITLKMLNALATMHQGKQVPDRLSDSFSGLRYFSEKLRDGAAARWEKRTFVTSEEV